MAAKMFSAKIVQVHAMQLLVHTEPNSDNAREIANWCNGHVIWKYDSDTGESDVYVTFTEELDICRVENTDWVVRDLEGGFYRLSDEDFRETFDTETFDAPPTCSHCLSDPRYTPMGDPYDKTCPVCGVKYSGPVRSKEFGVLLHAGLVAMDGD